MLVPQIVDKTELRVIGLEAAFIPGMSPDATNFAVIGPLWERFMHSANRVTNRVGDAMFGIIYGRPKLERAHPDELQYIAGVAVTTTAATPDGMVARTVPTGMFAVFTHRGPIKDIGATMNEIYRVWLPQSAYRHAQIADVEAYDRRFRMNEEDSEMEYWISVTPRT
jgi:predicted transcriptional regulator YdeE